MNKSEKTALKMLLKLTSTFSVTPSYEFIRYDAEDSPIFKFHLHTIMYLIFNITACVLSEYDTLSNETTSVTFAVLDGLSTLSLTVSAITVVISPVMSRKTWKEFFKQLQDVSRTLGPSARFSSTINRRRILIDCLIIQAIYAFKLFSNMYVCTIELDVTSSAVYIIPLDLVEYFVFISLILITSLNTIIRQKYSVLNNSLKIHSSQRGGNVRNMQANYRKLVKLTKFFNDIFGYQMLFIVETAVVKVLGCFFYASYYNGRPLMVFWYIVHTGCALVSILMSR